MSALFRWPYSYSCVSQVCHCWCPPFSAGNVAFPFICLPALSLLVSASSLAMCPPFAAGHVAFLFICLQVCHCWCPPFFGDHVVFLFICLPGLLLLVSAVFRWPCSISVHLSPRSVTVGVRPFPGHVAFLFICLPGLSLLVSALFRAM